MYWKEVAVDLDKAFAENLKAACELCMNIYGARQKLDDCLQQIIVVIQFPK